MTVISDETPLDLNEKLKQMMDVSRVNATLRAVEDERDVLQNKLAIEIDSRKEMEGWSLTQNIVCLTCVFSIPAFVWSHFLLKS